MSTYDDAMTIVEILRDERLPIADAAKFIESASFEWSAVVCLRAVLESWEGITNFEDDRVAAHIENAEREIDRHRASVLSDALIADASDSQLVRLRAAVNGN